MTEMTMIVMMTIWWVRNSDEHAADILIYFNVPVSTFWDKYKNFDIVILKNSTGLLLQLSIMNFYSNYKRHKTNLSS